MKTGYTLLMADTIMRWYPQADDYPYRSWCYPQGFLLWGFIRLYEKTGEEKFKKYVMDFCEKHVQENGDVPAFTGASLDDIMSGSIVVWAWHSTGHEKYKIACRRIRQVFDDYPRNRDGGFWHGLHLPYEESNATG